MSLTLGRLLLAARLLAARAFVPGGIASPHARVLPPFPHMPVKHAGLPQVAVAPRGQSRIPVMARVGDRPQLSDMERLGNNWDQLVVDTAAAAAAAPDAGEPAITYVVAPAPAARPAERRSLPAPSELPTRTLKKIDVLNRWAKEAAPEDRRIIQRIRTDLYSERGATCVYAAAGAGAEIHAIAVVDTAHKAWRLKDFCARPPADRLRTHGPELLRAVISRASQFGHVVEVDPRKDGLEDFYKGLGFIPAGAHVPTLIHKGVDTLVVPDTFRLVQLHEKALTQTYGTREQERGLPEPMFPPLRPMEYAPPTAAAAADFTPELVRAPTIRGIDLLSQWAEDAGEAATPEELEGLASLKRTYGYGATRVFAAAAVRAERRAAAEAAGVAPAVGAASIQALALVWHNTASWEILGVAAKPPEARLAGAKSELVRMIVAQAHKFGRTVQVNPESEAEAAFYEGLGFAQPYPEFQFLTHGGEGLDKSSSGNRLMVELADGARFEYRATGPMS